MSDATVQACGDAHISNFGGFAAPDRRLVFGPNDFDETLPGPWEWDVKRMAASVEVAGRDIGLSTEARRQIVAGCVRSFREGMRGFAAESHLDVFYDRLIASELVARFGGKLDAKDLLRTPALGLEGLDRPCDGQQIRARGLHARLRLVAGARPRPVGRSARDRGVPGKG
jgi:hypothetical protein